MTYEELWNLVKNWNGTENRPDHVWSLWKWSGWLPENAHVIEVGGCALGSTVCLASQLKGEKSDVLSIECSWLSDGPNVFAGPVQSDVYDTKFLAALEHRRVAGMENKISLFPGTSMSFLHKYSKIPDNYYDLIYIDGAHTYDWVWEDCKLLHHLRVGGVVLFDDWIPEVINAAVDAFKATDYGWLQVHNEFHRAFQKVDWKYSRAGKTINYS